MIEKIDIAGVHMQVGEDLKKYVTKKIGSLDHYLPRSARESLHAEIKFKELNAHGKSERTCEIVLYVPHEILTVKETTMNIYAAIDIAEEKLKTQLRKYKEMHGRRGLHRRLFARIKRNPV